MNMIVTLLHICIQVSSNSEPSASEFLENLKTLLGVTCIRIFVAG